MGDFAPLAAVGLIPNDSPSVEEMRGYIASEHVKWGALVKQFGSRGLAIGPGGREGFAVNAAQGAAAATDKTQLLVSNGNRQ